MRFLIIGFLLLFSTAIKAQKLPYINQTEAGILAGDGVVPSFTVQIFNGVRINRWKLEAGLACGVDVYSQIIVLPVAARFNWDPFNTRIISPYISLSTGYSFDWLQRKVENRRFDGGYMINPSMGLRIKTATAARINLGIGYRQQRAVMYQASTPGNIDFIWGGPDTQNSVTKEKYTFKRLSLSMGLSF